MVSEILDYHIFLANMNINRQVFSSLLVSSPASSMSLSEEFLLAMRPLEWDDFYDFGVILEDPCQYSEWLRLMECAIYRQESCWAVYTDSLESYEPYLVLSDSEKIEFEKRTNLYIHRLVNKSISKRLAAKLMRSKVPVGRQQLEFLKNYMTSDEEAIAPAILQFVQAMDPSTDVSPLKRYDELKYSQYVNLSDQHKARLLYTALGEPLGMETKFNAEQFKFTDLQRVVDLLEHAYLERKKLQFQRKRKRLSCTFCNRRGHLEERCFIKLRSTQIQEVV